MSANALPDGESDQGKDCRRTVLVSSDGTSGGNCDSGLE